MNISLTLVLWLHLKKVTYRTVASEMVQLHQRSRKLATIGMWLNAGGCNLAKPTKPDYASPTFTDDIKVHVMH